MSASLRLQLDRLVDRHLLGQRDHHHRGRAPVADELVEEARVPRHRPDLGDVGVGARRAQHRHAVAAGGRVDHAGVERAVALVAPLHLGQLPDLAERDQLVEPRRGRGQVGEDPARGRASPPAGPTSAGRAATPPWRPRGSARTPTGSRPPRSRCSPRAACRTGRSRAPARTPRRSRPGGPLSALASPIAAATVVLPTPPLPVTKTSRLCRGEAAIACRPYVRDAAKAEGVARLYANTPFVMPFAAHSRRRRP